MPKGGGDGGRGKDRPSAFLKLGIGRKISKKKRKLGGTAGVRNVLRRCENIILASTAHKGGESETKDWGQGGGGYSSSLVVWVLCGSQGPVEVSLDTRSCSDTL